MPVCGTPAARSSQFCCCCFCFCVRMPPPSILFFLLRLKQLMSQTVFVPEHVFCHLQVMGGRIRPHLGLIASALPKIWAAASAHITSHSAGNASSSSPGAPVAAASRTAGAGPGNLSTDTGAVVRLHSALIAVLTHLVCAQYTEPSISCSKLQIATCSVRGCNIHGYKSAGLSA